MRALQEAGFGTDHDYRVTSPHLKHQHLARSFEELLVSELRSLGPRVSPLHVLDVGAGHGGYSQLALAFGCEVTATEMSRPSLDHLRRTYGNNPRFSAVLDVDGSLGVLDDRTFSLIVCASVLHHIPDYLGFLERATVHLRPGGTLMTLQDPMWYPTMSLADRLLGMVAYFSWRLSQRDLVEGARTRYRRLHARFDESNPRDMVEYHVVRDGLDQEAIVGVLSPRFDSVAVQTYWSTQSALWQRVGEALGRTNTFGIVARGYAGSP